MRDLNFKRDDVLVVWVEPTIHPTKLHQLHENLRHLYQDNNFADKGVRIFILAKDIGISKISFKKASRIPKTEEEKETGIRMISVEGGWFK